MLVLVSGVSSTCWKVTAKLKEVDLNKTRLEREIDSLPVDAKYRERKLHDMTLRLDSLYDVIVELEEKIEDARLRRDAIKQQAITLENIYKIMVNFDCVYNIINDEEKRNVVTALIKEIEIYRNDESEYPLKRIGLNFPVFKDGGEVTELLWDKGNTVEWSCVVMIIRKAEEKDIPRIMELLGQVLQIHAEIRPDVFIPGTTKYTASELKELLEQEDKPIFVAAGEDDVCMGYAFCQLKEQPFSTNMVPFKALFIDDLCVDKQTRGQHIGESLFEYVKQQAKKLGCYEVTLNVWAGNTSAESFYEKMGMKTKERQMEYIL